MTRLGRPSPPPSHRASTAHLQALYPFVSCGGLSAHGPLIGASLLGGLFCFDPWELYRVGALTNPNLLVVGQIGRGKSAFIKTFVWRQLPRGRQAWIVDPKGEYGPLAEACGCRPVRLSPGGGASLNPLQLPVAGGPAGSHSLMSRRAELVGSLVSASLGRRLEPAERTAIELAARTVTPVGSRGGSPTLGDMVSALLCPDREAAASVHTDRAGLAADGRSVALELRRLAEGDLAGMFDRPTSPGIDANAAVVDLDLSAVFSSPALPALMTCAIAWLQASLGAGDTTKRLLVVDEAWAVLTDLSTARWVQSTFKLSRALGVANMAVVHRLSDLTAVGAQGSAEQRLAEGILADTETRVVFGLSHSEAELTGRLADLSAAEVEVVKRLPRGVALWKVGSRSFVVEHALAPSEAFLVDTDAAMAEPARA